MMRCEQFEDLIAADLAGEIDPGAKAGLAAHLERCPACALALGRLRAALGDLAAEEAPEPGPIYWTSFGGRVRERIAAVAAASRRRRRLLIAAAVVAACGIGLAATLRWPGRPAGRPGGPSASPVAAGAGATGDAGGGEAVAESRFDTALESMLGAGGAEAGDDLEAILDEVAPGDPFALAGGLDELDSDSDAGSGV